MRFEDVIGQEMVKSQLRQMADSGRLPHALLLLGPAGSGSLALAIALSQYLLCPDHRDGEACGACSHCTKAAKLIHPDVHFSFPVVGTNVTSDKHLGAFRQAILQNPYLDVNSWLQLIGAENKQGNINKEECLAIIHKLSLKTFEADAKILVMWLPEYLGKEGNRLLKLIEEPPEQTYFFLVAENSDLILNTILSRCQLIKVPALPDEDVIDELKNRFPELDAQAEAIAYLANGNFQEALQLAQQKANTEATAFLDWLRKGFQGNGIDLVKWTDQFATWGRENQKHFLQYGLHFLREMMVLKYSGAATARLQPQELQAAQKLAPLLDLDQMERIAELFSDCTLGVERNANPRILFLDASIQLHKIMRDKKTTPVG